MTTGTRGTGESNAWDGSRGRLLSRRGRLPALGLLAGVLALEPALTVPFVARGQTRSSSTPPPTIPVPTVTLYAGTPPAVPTVRIPRPTPTAAPRRVRRHTVRRHAKRHRVAKRAPTPTPTPRPRQWWIVGYLTSYCPGSAGSLSASGVPVHYGMLANNYYAFGTRVRIPILGMIGTVEDRFGGDAAWNQFDVWSPSCFGTPTGYFKVAIIGRHR